MYPAPRLALCAALMLAAAAPLAHAADAAGATDGGTPRSTHLKLRGVDWNVHGLANGLSSRLEGGWTIAVRMGRAIGGSTVYDRNNTGNARADTRPWATGAGRRAAVLSLTRSF
ncbi:MAG: hypothetical protein WCC39_16950 [Telluria sp.]